MHTCHCLSNCRHGSVSSASSDSSVSSLCAVLPPSMMAFFVNMSSRSLSLFGQLNFKSLGRDEKVIQQTFIFFTTNFRRLTLMPTADQVIQETFTLSDWNLLDLQRQQIRRSDCSREMHFMQQCNPSDTRAEIQGRGSSFNFS